MKWSAHSVAACLFASAVTSLAETYPKTADEAVARISDEERARVAALRERSWSRPRSLRKRR